jgi:endonuclease YncB( thermonuclease family)
MMIALLLTLSLLAENSHPITIERVKDGDTFVCDIALGFGVVLDDQPARIAAFDAWESRRIRRSVPISDEELAKGKLAAAALADIFAKAQRIEARPARPLRDVYGRLLLHVSVDGRDLGELMTSLGHSRVPD